MDILKQYWLIIIIFLVAISFNFYWYEFRPVQIRKGCFETADNAKQEALNFDNNWIMSGRELIKRASYEEIFNNEYNKCLMEKGIK